MTSGETLAPRLPGCHDPGIMRRCDCLWASA